MLALGWDVHGMESGWCAVCSGASPRQSASTPASNLQLSVQSIQARLHSQLLSGARCGKVMCSSHLRSLTSGNSAICRISIQLRWRW